MKVKPYISILKEFAPSPAAGISPTRSKTVVLGDHKDWEKLYKFGDYIFGEDKTRPLSNSALAFLDDIDPSKKSVVFQNTGRGFTFLFSPNDRVVFEMHILDRKISYGSNTYEVSFREENGQHEEITGMGKETMPYIVEIFKFASKNLLSKNATYMFHGAKGSKDSKSRNRRNTLYKLVMQRAGFDVDGIFAVYDEEEEASYIFFKPFGKIGKRQRVELEDRINA